LTSLTALETTTTMDVSIDWLNSSTGNQFLLAIGTAELPVRLRPLKESFARLHLTEAILALPGDRFVLRRPSPAMTVAGGTVIDAFPPRRLNRAKTFERLNKLAPASAAQRVEILTEESASGLSVAQLIRVTGMASIPPTPNLILIGGQQLVSKKWVEQRRQKLVEWLAAFHIKYPAAAGAPISQARLGIDAALLAPVFTDFSAITLRGDLVSLAGHQPQVSNADAQALAQLELLFRQAAFQPPVPDKNARNHLETLVKSGKLVRVSNDLIFHADVIAHIRQSLAIHKGKRFTVPDFKSWTNISRKYAIPLLEYLDQQRVTRREGDVRVVL
jgi:selenocysteine-specific elongation factor